MKNTAKIIFNSKGRDIELFYKLSNNPVQQAWQSIHADSTEFTMGIPSKYSLEYYIKKINDVCLQLCIPPLSNVTDEVLNQYHSLFVKADPPTPTWDELNNLIHCIENIKSNRFPEYNTNVLFFKKNDNTFIPIKESYKLWLTPNTDWGSLLLGYGTLGKHWLDIFKGNDNISDLVVQHTISSQTHLVFSPDEPYKKRQETRFYNWAIASGLDIPLDNLNKLSLGSYFLGQIIITDAFLNYHPVSSDWYVPNHICKLNWNRDMIGEDIMIKSLEFFDSDMYYDILCQHNNSCIKPIDD